VDEAIERVRKDPEDHAAMGYLRWKWAREGSDREWAKSTLERVLKIELRARPVYRLKAPAMVEVIARPEWPSSIFLSSPRKDHEIEYGIIIDGVDRRSDRRILNIGGTLSARGERKHTLSPYWVLTYVDERRAKPEGRLNRRKIWRCEWQGRQTVVRTVEKLPEGYLRTVSNPDLDRRMAECFELDFGEKDRLGARSRRRGSSLGCCLEVKRPLPAALGHDIMVSIDGQALRPLDRYHTERWIQNRPAYAVKGKGGTGLLYSAGLAIPGAHPEFKEPGKYRVKYVLVPSENAALYNIDTREYWGGTYESEEFEFTYEK
jgi:hypothetical protein